MARRSRFGTRRCEYCGELVTKNAVGRAAHQRGSVCRKTAAAMTTPNPLDPHGIGAQLSATLRRKADRLADERRLYREAVDADHCPEDPQLSGGERDERCGQCGDSIDMDIAPADGLCDGCRAAAADLAIWHAERGT